MTGRRWCDFFVESRVLDDDQVAVDDGLVEDYHVIVSGEACTGTEARAATVSLAYVHIVEDAAGGVHARLGTVAVNDDQIAAAITLPDVQCAVEVVDEGAER